MLGEVANGYIKLEHHRKLVTKDTPANYTVALH